jgi:hypothetical protein
MNEDTLLALLQEARDALPPGTPEDLLGRIDEALGIEADQSPTDIAEDGTSLQCPIAGEKVISLSDPEYSGVVTGPSPFEGGVVVRFSRSLQYPCSIPLLEVVDRVPASHEQDDFEAWLYLQDNDTRDCQDLELLTRRWRLDFDWHDNPRDTYRSKA